MRQPFVKNRTTLKTGDHAQEATDKKGSDDDMKRVREEYGYRDAFFMDAVVFRNVDEW